jgi:hypothetical protein
MDSFTVMHDGTGDHLHIPLGAGVAITATVIPVIHRVLGRDTRLGTRLIIESNGVTGKGMAFRRTAPFDPEILLSRRRETVEWASAAIVTALEQLAGVANDVQDPVGEESATETHPPEPNQEPAPASDDISTSSLAFPSALRDSLGPVRAEIATLNGHITQLDSVIWEMYGAIEELRTEITNSVRRQEPVASLAVDSSTPIITTLQPSTESHIEATAIHHLAPADVLNLRKSIANPIHALDFIRQQRSSASQTTTFDSSFDTWEAIVLVASGKQHEAAHLAGTIVWQGDPDAAYALIVICLTAGRLPQPIDAIVDTSSALIAGRVQVLITATRNVSHEDRVAFLSVLSTKVAKSTALTLASDMLASASKVEEAEVLLAVGAIDEKRAVDEYSLRFESMPSEAAYKIGLTLLKGLQEYGHGRKLVALLVSCANKPGDSGSSEQLSGIIEGSPTVELAARAAEAIVLSIPRPERNEALQHAIGHAIKNGLNSPLRTNGPFVTSCRLFLSQIQEVEQLADLAESISALLAHGAPEPIARVPESAAERDRRILAARKVVVVGGFPPRWLEEIEDLGCEVKWFQSEVKARPPLEAIFHAATDADIVIVDRRVSHATTIPLRVFVRQRRIPIQDFVERNKGRFLDLLRNRFS